jgi:hypothetical protein
VKNLPAGSMYAVMLEKSTIQKFALECEWEIYQKRYPPEIKGYGGANRLKCVIDLFQQHHLHRLRETTRLNPVDIKTTA